MKILHLPTSVGNHGYSLACAERRAGHDSHSLVIDKNPLGMKADELVVLPKSRLKNVLKRIKTFYQVSSKFDIYHFNFGQTLLDFPSYGLDYLDLPFYRGHKFATFNGSDIRQPVDKSINPFSPYLKDVEDRTSYLKRQERINKLFNNIEFAFVQNPDLLRFLPEGRAEFIPYIKESWFDSDGQKKTKRNRKFTIVHAPTNREVKGSRYIIEAISKLKDEFDIEFRLIENMTHSQAKEAYRNADLLIDQVRLGWYGGVAVEAMRMGVPVAVYINEADLIYISDDMKRDIDEAFLRVNPTNIYERIAEVLDSPLKYNYLVDASLDYVNTHHDPDKLIEKVLFRYRMNL
ncbi:hypothetical protein CEW91_09885 [Idiomarina piscisalsi]|uniref:Glycosyltransferase n=1 Tax=Idiomarina piscisalsi TaxID=1096243 RepID=A0ABM6LV10_9GAMM|nr:glycosyltransferase family 1 protein [Idiomarina piscisalsi]ASG66426.1 hypothetical protein CEW91_09885 [Idiomarina piscisalsi]